MQRETPQDDDLSQLPERLAGGHRRRHRKVEAARALFHGNGQPRIGGGVDGFRRTGRFPTEQKNVAIGIGKVRVTRLGPGGEQDKTPALALAPELERFPGRMAGERGALKIIHPRALQIPVGEIKAGRLDQIDREAEAGGETENGAGVSGNVWLVKRDTHAAVSLDMAECCLPDTAEDVSTERRNYGWRVAATVGISPPLSTRTEGERHDNATTSHDLAPRRWPQGLTADSVRQAPAPFQGSYPSQSVGISSRSPRTFAMHNRFPRRPNGRNDDFFVPQLDPTRPTLQDRRLEAWALTLGVKTPLIHEDRTQRPHRGQLPDIDLGQVAPAARIGLMAKLKRLLR